MQSSPTTIDKEYEIIQDLLNKQNITIPGGYSTTPYVLENSVYENVAKKSELVIQAMENILKEYLVNKEIQSYFPEVDHLKEFILLDGKNNLKRFCQLARFDIIRNEKNQFGILELNSGHPGLVLMAPNYRNLFLQAHRFDGADENKFLSLPMENLSFWYDHLTKVYQETRNTVRKPCIAFIHHATYGPITTDLGEFLLFGKNFGYDVMVGTYDQLVYNGEYLSVNGKRIDVLWNKCRILLDDNGKFHPGMYEHSLDEVKPLMDAYKDKNVLFVNGLLSEFVSESKKTLAMLRDPKFQYLFTSEQQDAIKELVLPTFVIHSNQAGYLNVKKQVSQNKDEYVIKKALDSRGRSIFIGKQFNQEDWDQLVEKSVDGPYVIQNFIDSKHSLVIHPKTKTETIMTTTLAFYIIGGRSAGYMVRSSPSLIHNIFHSGFLQPSFVQK
eukprot:gene464-588_t